MTLIVVLVLLAASWVATRVCSGAATHPAGGAGASAHAVDSSPLPVESDGMRNRQWTRSCAVLALSLVLFAAGCGSSDDSQTDSEAGSEGAVSTSESEGAGASSSGDRIRVQGRTCGDIVSVRDLESATGRTISPSDQFSYEETDEERQCLYQVDGSEINELIIEASEDVAKGERLADAPVFDLGPLDGVGDRAAISNSTLIALTDTGFMRVNAAASYFSSDQLLQISQLVFTGLTNREGDQAP